MMPWDVVLRQKLVRWTICSQEICFETPVLAAFFGAGKVRLSQSRRFLGTRKFSVLSFFGGGIVQ